MPRVSYSKEEVRKYLQIWGSIVFYHAKYKEKVREDRLSDFKASIRRVRENAKHFPEELKPHPFDMMLEYLEEILENE